MKTKGQLISKHIFKSQKLKKYIFECRPTNTCLVINKIARSCTPVNTPLNFDTAYVENMESVSSLERQHLELSLKLMSSGGKCFLWRSSSDQNMDLL